MFAVFVGTYMRMLPGALAATALAACSPAVSGTQPAGGAPPGVTLPGALNAIPEEVPDAPVVSVVGGDVRVDGQVVDEVRSIQASGRLTRVDGLFKALHARREGWKSAHAGEPFPGVVEFAFDGDTLAVVVKSVFQTAAFAGYPNASFLVRTSDGTGRFNVDAQVPGPPPKEPPKNRPSANEGAMSLHGRLPPEVIQRIVRGSFGKLRACYEQGLLRDANLHGKVSIRFVIERDGSVPASGVSDAASTLPDPDVVACVLRVYSTLSFPKPDGGTVTVVYPINFDPGN